MASLLDEKGIGHYCPLNKVTRQWSDRKKVVLEPLFKGYVFICIAEDKKWEVLQINGIVNYVYWLGKPARIREEEIDTIRKFLHEFNDVEVMEGDMSVNKAVKIKQGVLMNYQGLILEASGNRAKVRIVSMGIELSAYFDKKNLELITNF